jgi:uncharacterized protein
MSIFKGLYIGDAGEKGRGVFTKTSIPANTVIEVSPVIILSPGDRKRIEETSLYYYIFEWGENIDHGAVGLGYVSMYNHASPSNCEYLMDYEEMTITVQTMRAIRAGEELCINYSAGWDDWQPLWFDDKNV